MRVAIFIAVAICTVVAVAMLAASAKPSRTNGISGAALAAAGRQATLKTIDYGSIYCDSEMSVEEWLKAVVGHNARVITWTGGKCELVNDPQLGIDAAAWPYCALATISLVHPKERNDKPMIEIYLEKPNHGRSGTAYAFRSMMMTRDDGPDYLRFRKDFEAEWDERFRSAPSRIGCTD